MKGDEKNFERFYQGGGMKGDKKTCNRCQKIFPLETGFYRNKDGADGRRPECKSCSLKAVQKSKKNARLADEGYKKRVCGLHGCDILFTPKRGATSRYCCKAHRLKGRNYSVPIGYTSQIDRSEKIDCTQYYGCLDASARANRRNTQCKGCKRYVQRSDASYFFRPETYNGRAQNAD